MTILVIAEHDNASIKASTLNTIAAAQKIGGDIHVLVAGSNAQAAADAAAKIAGVAKCCSPTRRNSPMAWLRTSKATVLNIAKDYSHILAPATAYGKNIAPRIAAHLDVAQISDITAVDSPDTFERPIYAGNAIATVQSQRSDQGHHGPFDRFRSGGSGRRQCIGGKDRSRSRRRHFAVRQP